MKVNMKFGSLATLLFCLGMANSLRCKRCVNRIGKCTETDVEVCKPQQDSCFFEIKDVHYLMARTVKRGCGTSESCRRYHDGNVGLLSRTLHCCSTDLCEPLLYPANFSGSPNGVTCQSCIGDKDDCGQNAPSEPCYDSRNRCVQISQQFLPDEQLERIIKGCGNASFTSVVAAYQIGKDFAYVDQRVCTNSNCNNGNFTALTPGRSNGLQCYTCRETGKGECDPKRLELLNCMGIMDRCLHVITNENRDSPVTILKGCATESTCTRHLDLGLMRQKAHAACCKDSLCNRAGCPVPELRAMGTAFALWLALIAWAYQ
ncbi:urokinase plasminogen activator surface receptor-like isoform X2 [Varanus komodoensis]|uniref:urokinase plasminogen activator surface receptor-like isoform X2 n=1 Tax=Varanus komodoensis TaxID=61221 RepID=UPI001CF797B8|nr:urokinase plasminogen activator surface receptor-like isoform X2 [Varanus komodoensis]